MSSHHCVNPSLHYYQTIHNKKAREVSVWSGEKFLCKDYHLRQKLVVEQRLVFFLHWSQTHLGQEERPATEDDHEPFERQKKT